MALSREADARHTPVLGLQLPANHAGLLLRRRPGEPTGWGSASERRFIHILGDRPGLSFLPVHQAELIKAANALARLPPVRVVVLHPPGASPQQTALALAVADLLTEPDHPRVPGTVTSGTPPPLNNGLTTVRHDIHLTTAGRTHDKFVWQLLATGQLPI